MSARLVIDANVTLAQVLPLPYSDQVVGLLQSWSEQGREIFVPTLWEYEVISALRKAVVRDWLSQEQAFQVIDAVLRMEIRQVAPAGELDKMALKWAGILGQGNAYVGQ